MKNYYFNNESIIFNKFNVQTSTDLIKSDAFYEILSTFYKKAQHQDTYRSLFVEYKCDDLIKIFCQIVNEEIDYQSITERYLLYTFCEQLYDYWRKLYRFAALDNLPNATALVMSSNHINDLILITYRVITQRLYGKKHTVYRQLSAGMNVITSIIKNDWNSTYAYFNSPWFIKVALIRPPFIIYSKSNKRVDFFDETKVNFLKTISLNKNDFYAIPLKVGKFIAYVYFHKDTFYQAVGLVNLFEPAYNYEFLNKKPDLVLIYGIDSQYDGKIYHDIEDNIRYGIINNKSKNDYFGYLKKMLLTLHNLQEIGNGNLPIHGAMVSLTLANNKIKNIVFIGDSGAGKSETVEAIKKIGGDKIRSISTIFDDMGVFSLQDDKVVATGSEVGAFVRLDDLAIDYAYNAIDRAIFVNPNKKNARVIIPISQYETIVSPHQVDYVFYANNYKKTKKGLQIIKNVSEFKDIVIGGKRMAKETTSEVGLTTSFFANPFGPMQCQKECKILINQLFDNLVHDGTFLGEIYTQLSIPNYQALGPELAAKSLLRLLFK